MAIVNGYATVEELARKMGMDAAKTALHTPLMEASIEGASRLIDLQANTFFFQKTIPGEVIDSTGLSDNGFYLSAERLNIIAPAPVLSIASLTEDGVPLTEQTTYSGPGEYFLRRVQGIISNESGWSISPLAIVIAGDFGYTTVPGEVREICLTVASVYTRLDNRIVTSEDGDMDAILSSRIPSWVFQTLRRLRRPIV